jgi:hypothetical protein
MGMKARGKDSTSDDNPLIRLMKQRIQVLEREILRIDPDLAGELGIE